jgi:hypothetical protein
MSKVFVNSSITYGIENYLNKQTNQSINNIHIFEMHVIEMLVKIYGEINIINPYKLGDEKQLIKNLQIYGMKSKTINRLFILLNEYSRWLNSTINSKNNIITEIEKILIQMVLLKNKKKNIPFNEITYYNNFFLPENGDLKQIQNIVSIDPHLIEKIWKQKNCLINNKLTLEFNEIETELFDDATYRKFGLSLNEVKQLSNLKIKEINQKILDENDDSGVNGGSSKNKPLQLVLTSGNGFTDTIVLLSVMATEIMVGLLIAFTIARR